MSALENLECEGGANPALMIRWGWSRSGIEQALPRGAKVKVGMVISRSNPTSGLVLEIFDEAGKLIYLAMPKENAHVYPGPGIGIRPYGGPG